MSASSHTNHYQLPIYEPEDITSWLTDFNGAMQKIDTAIYEASQTGGSVQPINVVQTVGDSTTDVMSQKAVTNEIISLNNQMNTINESLNYKQDRLESSGDNQNIKTINGQSVLGKGDIEISNFEPIPITLDFPETTDETSSIRSSLLAYIEKKNEEYFLHVFGEMTGRRENYQNGYVVGSLSSIVNLQGYTVDTTINYAHVNGSMYNGSSTGAKAETKTFVWSTRLTENTLAINDIHSNYNDFETGNINFHCYMDVWYKLNKN